MPQNVEGRLTVTATSGDVERIVVDGDTGDLTLGGDGVDGDLVILDRDGNTTAHVNGRHGNLRLGGSGHDGDILLFDSSASNADAVEVATIHMNGEEGNLRLGGNGRDGDIFVEDDAGNRTAHLNGQEGNLTLGGGGKDGDVFLEDGSGSQTVHLNGEFGNVTLGGNGQDGDIFVRDAAGNQTAHLNGEHGNLRLGGSGHDGDLVIFASGASNDDDFDEATIHLNGDTGDILLRNADAAERFDVAVGATAEPGSVMVLDDDARLRPCEREYDGRVVGVVAGAGRYRPGIVLDHGPGAEERAPISILGKVTCRADATRAPIRVGDLLTSSSRPGHAMRAERDGRAFGAVIGKALSPLDGGVGFVDLMVALY